MYISSCGTLSFLTTFIPYFRLYAYYSDFYCINFNNGTSFTDKKKRT